MLDIFFTPRDKTTACGMWSTTYIIALLMVLSVIIICLYLSRNMSHKAVKKTIIIMAIWTIISEIIKMIFVGITYGIEEVEFIPLYFCSLFMYCTVFASLPNQKIKRAGLSFLFFGGIVGASAFFLYPSACIPNYPIYHYMCIRTMLYHGSMIYTGILIVITKYYEPTMKDFKYYIIEMLIIGILAYAMNVCFDKDYMYIQKPLNFEIVKNIYDKIPQIYPIIALIFESITPFFITYGIYICIKKYLKEINKNVYS